MGVYEELRAAGCVLDSCESTLYVQDTDTAREILSKYPHATFSTFISEKEPGGRWLDVPFQWQPFWDRKARKT